MRTRLSILVVFAVITVLLPAVPAGGSPDAVWANGSAEAVVTVAATFDCAGQTSVPTVECEALVALFNSTNGPVWKSNNGWLSDPNPCSWYAVTCSAGSVTSLFLGTNQLWGSIPPELGNLTSLQWLNLSENQLSGSIPPELGNLANLIHLYLGVNRLSGSIPPELGKLSNLEDLFLYRNQLSGPIPPELGNLIGLWGLYLSENQLSGSIPPELGNLTHLVSLALSSNSLSGPIPPGLGNLTNLSDLNLSENQLSGIVPVELGNLTNLQWLDLSLNQLSGSIAPELGNLTVLRGLYLSENQLSGAVPVELGNLSFIRWLYLSGQTGCLVASTAELAAWLSSLDPGWNDGCGPTFSDDDGNIFEPDIEWLASQGITKGCNPPTNDIFCPAKTVTRGQMAAFLHRALPTLPEVRPAIDFTDDDDSIFEGDIEWLYSRGITQGNTPTTFNPNGPVTRGQMAAFLVRALKYTDDGGGDLFIDDDNSIFRGDIDRLGTAGVTRGCNPSEGNTKFCPDSYVTRGQMAAFLHRALGGTAAA